MFKVIFQSAFLFAVIPLLTSFSYAPATIKKVYIKSFGAKGDGKTDDSGAFAAAVNAGNIIVVPPGTYLFKKELFFRHLTHKTIEATGATIINSDNTNGILFFDNCSFITINGGRWTRSEMPRQIGQSGKEHAITFESTDHVKVQKATIDRSPQMGICMMNVVNATIANNSIRNCFRDGIYAHYSAALNYLNNHLDNIKDDAMSMHDYGLQNQKTVLHKFGYTQAGQGLVKGNTVSNCYEGFSSIACTDVTVTNNIIKHTVNAGIAIFNSEKLFKGSTARVKNITITNNTLSYTGGTQTIMGVSYPNKGQLSSGRAAIYVAANDADDFIQHPTTRLHNIVIKNNRVSNAYTNGVYLAQIDKLVFQNNKFVRCNMTPDFYAKKNIEISNSTDMLNTRNTVSGN